MDKKTGEGQIGRKGEKVYEQIEAYREQLSLGWRSAKTLWTQELLQVLLRELASNPGRPAIRWVEISARAAGQELWSWGGPGGTCGRGMEL